MHIRADLVESALAMAVVMCGELGRFARRHNLTRSVGRVGVLRKRWRRIILGNSKSRVLRPIPGPTRTGPKLAVGDWVERIYNRRGRSALGMLRPAQYKNRNTQERTA